MADMLSNAFRAKLLRAMLCDPTLLREARRFIDPTDFAQGRERDLVTFTLAHFDKYGQPPDQFVFKERASDLGIDEDSLPEVLEDIFRTPSQLDYIKSHIVEFSRTRRMAAALEEAAGMLGTRDWDEILTVLRAAEIHGDTSERRMAVFPRDALEIEQREPTITVPTGISSIDAHLPGGLPSQAIGVVMAPPNHGKSSLLIYMGGRALRRGFSVVHFTLEMTIEQVHNRYDATLGGLSRILNRKPTGPRRANQRGSGPRLVVIARNAGSLTVNGMREDLRAAWIESGTRPGLVVVDYPALMRSSRVYEQKRHELADIYRDLHGLAQQLDIPIWAAHQTNRQGMESYRSDRKVITIEDTAECFEIAAIVEVMVSINATPEEREGNLSRLFLAKNRLGPGFQVSLVYCDYESCHFTDEESNSGGRYK